MADNRGAKKTAEAWEKARAADPGIDALLERKRAKMAANLASNNKRAGAPVSVPVVSTPASSGDAITAARAAAGGPDGGVQTVASTPTSTTKK